jgi:hypothetical protein
MVEASKWTESASAWDSAGRPYCDHSRSEKEYYLSAQTGDRGCLDCGETWWSDGDTPSPSGGDTAG